ncbi:MAG: Secretion system C-terminal sorting domain, partial [Flavipsychrobacter sp.]|nr:Secretion system C-terminal sorting domain [Flavipsychrobacter sp.]
TGDVFLKKIVLNNGPWNYRLETVVQKTGLPNGIRYVINSWDQRYIPPLMKNVTTGSIDTVTYLSGVLTDTTLMPEEWGQPVTFRYFSNDTSLCLKSAAYIFSSNFVHDSVVHAFEPCGIYAKYKKGIGRIAYFECYDPTPYNDYEETLIGYQKGNKSCGYPAVLGVTSVADADINIYPNPSHGILYIRGNITSKPNTAIIICDPQGKEVYRIATIPQNGQLQLSLPDGVYYLKCMAGEQYAVKKITIIN